MKAVYLEKLGSPDNIIVGDLPIPQLTPNAVLIKVSAVAANYVDAFIRAGIYQTPLPSPYILGRDAIGQIVQTGERVTKFQVGNWVWTNSMGYDGRQGVCAEYAVVPEERLFLAPTLEIDPLALVGAVHSSATAAIVLSDIMQLKAKQSILIEGAAGHVGTKLVQLAHLLDAHIVTTSQNKDFDKLRQLGANACFDYQDPQLFQQLKAYLPQGFHHIIDTSGQVTLQQNSELLALKGTLTLITRPKDSAFDAAQFYMKSQQIKGFVISQATLPQLQRAGKWLTQAFNQGLLLEENLALYQFEQAQTVHQLLDTRAEARKMVLVP